METQRKEEAYFLRGTGFENLWYEILWYIIVNEVNAFFCKGDRIELNRLVDMLMDGELV